MASTQAFLMTTPQLWFLTALSLLVHSAFCSFSFGLLPSSEYEPHKGRDLCLLTPCQVLGIWTQAWHVVGSPFLAVTMENIH